MINASSGGLASQSVMVKNCYGSADLSDQCELYMLKTFYSQDYSHVNFAAGFTERSRADIIDLFGGDPSIADPSLWSNRVVTIDDNPVLTNVATVNITHFITNDTIRANVERAIASYYTDALNKMNNFVAQFNAQLNSPRSVVFISVYQFDGQIESNSAFTLSPGQSMPVPKSSVLPVEEYICSMPSGNSVQSLTDNNDINAINSQLWNQMPQWAGQYGIFVTTPQGAVTNYGCSQSVYYWKPAPTSNNLFFSGYCCINCIPTSSCSGNQCYYQGCSCPTY